MGQELDQGIERLSERAGSSWQIFVSVQTSSSTFRTTPARFSREDSEDLIDSRRGRRANGLELVLVGRLADLPGELMVLLHEILLSHTDHVEDGSVG